MIDQTTKERIGWWLLKARSQRDYFVKFILYWFCFNAWITNLSNKDHDTEAIKWFLNNDNCLKAKWLDIWSEETKSWLTELKNLSPVEDMRPNHHGEYTYLNNTDNLDEIVWYIYKIRCNLFHGSKNPNDPREANLVELSGKILQKWIEWVNLKC